MPLAIQQSRLWKRSCECVAGLRGRDAWGRWLLLWLYLMSAMSGGMTLTSPQSCRCSQEQRRQGSCCCQSAGNPKPCCAAKLPVKPCCAKQKQAAKPCCQTPPQTAEDDSDCQLGCRCGCRSGKLWTPGVPPHLAPAALPPLLAAVETLHPPAAVCYLAPALPLESPPPKALIG